MRGQSAIKAHKPKRFYQWANLELCGLGPARNTFHIEWSRRLKIESFTQRKKNQRTGGSAHWKWRDKIWRSREEKLGVEKLTAAFKNVKPTFGQKFKETKIFRTLRFSVLLEGCHPCYSRLVRVLLNQGPQHLWFMPWFAFLPLLFLQLDSKMYAYQQK